MLHHPDDLIEIFAACFGGSHRTQLVRGGDEPLYLPASSPEAWHQIQFARGYFSSALHEVAHWLIAGPTRRQLEDYGYWYEPDGRNPAQQRAFEQVEVKPQALEWILSEACQLRFQLSADNLNGAESDPRPFARAVIAQAQRYCVNGLPARAEILARALRQHYGTTSKPALSAFSMSSLGFQDE